jgi:hypothetical protein
MNPLFADTFHFLALVNESDAAHSRAVEASRDLNRRVVTTAWVLIEVGDALARPAGRQRFMELVEVLRNDPQVTIVPPTQDLFDRGIALYGQRADKDWSLTDCISFVVMREMGIAEALTGDQHFAQAGFRCLLE